MQLIYINLKFLKAFPTIRLMCGADQNHEAASVASSQIQQASLSPYATLGADILQVRWQKVGRALCRGTSPASAFVFRRQFPVLTH
jgi:hypothetical protein